jgi:hypothetical protein
MPVERCEIIGATPRIVKQRFKKIDLTLRRDNTFVAAWRSVEILEPPALELCLTNEQSVMMLFPFFFLKKKKKKTYTGKVATVHR